MAGGQKRLSERNAQIVAMRAEGATYQQIADALNLTRQRIEQILRRDAPEHCHPQPLKPRLRCVDCGKEWATRSTTSRRCRSCDTAHRRHETFERSGAKWEQFVDAVIAARRAGKTWWQCGREAGFSERSVPATQTRFLGLIRRLAQHGIHKDTSGIFPGVGQYERRKAA
jgi:hypothetical protein